MRMLAIVTQAAMCCLLSDICNVDTAGVVITGRKQDAAVGNGYDLLARRHLVMLRVGSQRGVLLT